MSETSEKRTAAGESKLSFETLYRPPLRPAIGEIARQEVARTGPTLPNRRWHTRSVASRISSWRTCFSQTAPDDE